MPARSTYNPAPGELVFTKQSQFSPPAGLAAGAWLAQNSRLGFAPKNRPLHQGIAFAKPLTASGLRHPLYDFRVGPRCSAKERDGETGLDYFGARYFSGAQGRFTSPDPLLNSGHPANPQTWNRYSYTLNNPLRYTDPTGMYVWGKCSGTEDECKAEQQRFRDSVANLKTAAAGLEAGSKERKKLDKVIKKLGDEGKGNIKINFGDAGSTNGVPNAGLTVGNNITINYAAIDSVKTGWSLNASESSALDVGVTGHEATHAGGGPSVLGFVGMHFEHAAYWNESLIYQGLHNTDRPFQLWNESWLQVDQQKFPVDKTREQAIQHWLHPDSVPAPVVPPPGGQQ